MSEYSSADDREYVFFELHKPSPEYNFWFEQKEVLLHFESKLCNNGDVEKEGFVIGIRDLFNRVEKIENYLNLKSGPNTVHMPDGSFRCVPEGEKLFVYDSEYTSRFKRFSNWFFKKIKAKINE